MSGHSWYNFLEIPTHLRFRNIYYVSRCFLVVRHKGRALLFIITLTRACLFFDFVKPSEKLGERKKGPKKTKKKKTTRRIIKNTDYNELRQVLQ